MFGGSPPYYCTYIRNTAVLFFCLIYAPSELPPILPWNLNDECPTIGVWTFQKTTPTVLQPSHVHCANNWEYYIIMIIIYYFFFYVKIIYYILATMHTAAGLTNLWNLWNALIVFTCQSNHSYRYVVIVLIQDVAGNRNDDHTVVESRYLSGCPITRNVQAICVQPSYTNYSSAPRTYPPTHLLRVPRDALYRCNKCVV